MRRALLLFLSVLLLAGLALPASAAEKAVTVTIDGTPVTYDDSYGYPFLDGNGRTQVPFRRTMETFGCTVSWSRWTRTATAKKDGVTVDVPIGQSYILVNGTKVTIDSAALIRDGRTYLPIRAVAEAFGAMVTWDRRTATVAITTGADLVRVHFIDVGQGDATLIDCGETEVLIDGGDNNAGPVVVDYLRPYVDGKLDYLIATHPDADHIGGLDDVLAAYAVGEVIDSGYISSTRSYRDYITAAQSEAGCTFSHDSDRVLSLGPETVLCILETGDDWDNANDSSVVCELVCGNVRVLFTGDMTRDAEQARLSLFGDVDVLKVGHHGSAYSTSREFLDVIRPEYAVISYQVGNDYHHPAASALRRLLYCGATIYGTGKSGTVILTTDGTSCSFNTSNALTMDDAGA